MKEGFTHPIRNQQMKDIHCDRCLAKFKRAKQIIYNFCVDSLKELNLIIQQVF